MPGKIYIDFARPPSANRLWRHRRLPSGKVSVYLDKKYSQWLNQFALEWLRQKPRGFCTITGGFHTTIIVRKQRMDIDNLAKPILDAAQRTGIISNDKNNQQITTRIGQPEEAPLGCRLIIEEIS